MPRKSRFYVAGMPVHVVQRGNNRQPIFFDESDNHLYLAWLKEAAGKYDCSVHAYVLMTNHVHLLITPKDSSGVSRLMQYIGRYYVPHINHTYGRSGTLWEGRYKSSLIDAEDYLLICSRYIELNPVRASIVGHPSEYVWTSYGANAEGKPNAILKPHEQYLALGAAEGSDAQLTVIYFALMLTMWLYQRSGYRGKRERLWVMTDSVNRLSQY